MAAQHIIGINSRVTRNLRTSSNLHTSNRAVGSSGRRKPSASNKDDDSEGCGSGLLDEVEEDHTGWRWGGVWLVDGGEM